MSLRHQLLGLCVAALGVGCASMGPVQEIDQQDLERLQWGHPPEVASILSDLYEEGEMNAVLNFNRLGQAAFRQGNLDLAATALDEAIARIESVYADNEMARKARSNFTSEATKDFKGEPYERSMAYFYRGLIDLAEGDFDNARAMFLAAEFQDTLSDQEVYRADFALMSWLAGWASHCGNQPTLASDFFDHASRVMQRRPALNSGRATERGADSLGEAPTDAQRTLVVSEWGRSPMKLGSGEHDEILTFSPGSNFSASLDVAVLESDRSTRTVGLYERMDFQAMTRGGRPIDGILEGQARFKDNAETVGAVSSAVGTNLMTQSLLSGDADLGAAGGAVALVGLLSSAMASASKPAADTRRWASLPGTVSVAAADVELQDDIEVRLVPEAGAPVLLEPLLDRRAADCRLVYVAHDSAKRGRGSRATRVVISDRELRRTQRKNASRDSRLRGELLASMTHPDWVDPTATGQADPPIALAGDAEPAPSPIVDQAPALSQTPSTDLTAEAASRPSASPQQSSAPPESESETALLPASNPNEGMANQGENSLMPQEGSTTPEAVHMETATGAFPRLNLEELWRDVDLSDPDVDSNAP